MLIPLVILGFLASILDAFPQSNGFSDDRIVNGDRVDITQRPFQLSLRRYKSASQYVHFCGASILTKNFALTAAHCTAGEDVTKRELAVAAGITSFYQKPDQKLMVLEVFDHPQYNKKVPYDCDISLLMLEGFFTYNDRVKPIRLPSTPEEPDSVLTVSGWGVTRENGTESAYLRKAEVFCFDQKECVEKYRNLISENMFCAGYRSGLKDSCQGDSGGPITDGDILYGIVSWGRGCARPDLPGVYTKVYNFIDWINVYSNLFVL